MSEEAKLLATIGSSLASQTLYETQVLNDAISSHVPNLTGIGFPDLSSLVPSYVPSSSSSNGKTGTSGGGTQKRKRLSEPESKSKSPPPLDLPHVLTTLQNVCSTMDSLSPIPIDGFTSSSSSSSSRETLLRMKRQILLSYLSTNTDRSLKEFDDEERFADVSSSSYSQKHRSTKTKRYKTQPSILPKQPRRRESNGEEGGGEEGGHYFLSSSTRTLEDIKASRHIDPPTTTSVDLFLRDGNARFGKQALDACEDTRELIRWRKDKRERRKHGGVVGGDGEGDEWDVEEERMRLWKRRNERMEERRRRRLGSRVRVGNDDDVDGGGDTMVTNDKDGCSMMENEGTVLNNDGLNDGQRNSDVTPPFVSDAVQTTKKPITTITDTNTNTNRNTDVEHEQENESVFETNHNNSMTRNRRRRLPTNTTTIKTATKRTPLKPQSIPTRRSLRCATVVAPSAYIEKEEEENGAGCPCATETKTATAGSSKVKTSVAVVTLSYVNENGGLEQWDNGRLVTKEEEEEEEVGKVTLTIEMESKVNVKLKEVEEEKKEEGMEMETKVNVKIEEDDSEEEDKLAPKTIVKVENDEEEEVNIPSEDSNNNNDEAEPKELTGVKQETEQQQQQQQQQPESKITCPICQTALLVPVEEDSDEFLAKHMGGCDGDADGNGKRRSGRILQRTRTKRLVRYYGEGNEGDDSEDDIGAEPVNEIDIDVNEVEYDDDDDDEEEAFVGDLEEDDQNDEIIENSNTTKTQSFRRSTPPPIDDYSEHDYEDRVDEWISTSLHQSMPTPSEADTNESKPGAVTYPGGLEIPAWINDRLFGYQRTSLRWMWELYRQGCGGIVGDEMGLGKTVQLCSYLGCMAASRKLRSVLVICPATMLSHWTKELEKWSPGLRRVVVHSSVGSGSSSAVMSGSARAANTSVSSKLLLSLEKWLTSCRRDRVNEPIDSSEYDSAPDPRVFCGTGYVVVTTFENVRRAAQVWVGHDWSYVVMDEGQKIRNPDADVTLTCKRLRTPHRLLLSGTPIQNDLRELWSLFDFVFPGRLGTLPVFESEFAWPIKRGGYTNASPMQVQLAYRCALVLRDLINPYLLRRRKKDLSEVSRMPGKTEQVLFCKLSPCQRSIYENYLQSPEVKKIVQRTNQGSNRTEWFGPIIKLRKICNHPDLLSGDKDGLDSIETLLHHNNSGVSGTDGLDSDEDSCTSDSFEQNTYQPSSPSPSTDDAIAQDDLLVSRSGKLEVLAKILPLWHEQGHRVLLFSQWKKTLNIIQKFVVSRGWKFARMDGDTNVASRQRLVDGFNGDKSCFLMLLTTKTGGVGLNLIGADRVILFDPDWNPQSDAQARERAWRFGQTKAVTVYRLITAGTIEEKIYHRQIFKTALTNSVLQDPKQRRMFSRKDLNDLFTLKEEGKEDGVTETGEMTRKRGVVIDPTVTIPVSTGNGSDHVANKTDGPSSSSSKPSSKDDAVTLSAVFQSKGLAGVFDHDFVEQSNNDAHVSRAAREREENAKRAAAKAAESLRRSCPNGGGGGDAEFDPTWTGSQEPMRFGGVRTLGYNEPERSTLSTVEGLETRFGGAGAAGIATGGSLFGSGGGPLDSGSLLQSLRERNERVAGRHGDGGAISNDYGTESTSTASSRLSSSSLPLVDRIRTFVQRTRLETGEGPTTDAILEEFKDVKDKGNGVEFRTILKRTARVVDGRWVLV